MNNKATQQHSLRGWKPDANQEDLRVLSDELQMAYQRMQEGRIEPEWSLSETEERVSAISFDEHVNLQEAIREASELMEHGDLRSAGSGCFGYFNPSPAWPAVVADAIVGARNPQACLTTHAPASVYMERHVIQWMLEHIGLPNGSTGHFTSGGSEANATGLTIALMNANADYAQHGVRSFAGAPKMYASAESHLAWLKIAKSSGLGTDSIRLVPTNGRGQMDVTALQAMIE